MSIFNHIFPRFRESIILFLYIILSFIMMLSSDSAIVEGVRSSSLFSIGFIQEKLDAVESYFSLLEKNRELRTENTILAYDNFQLQDALLENIRLRKMLQFKHEIKYSFIPAKVIGFSPQDFVTGYILSSEHDTEIDNNAAVMTANGLVGKVVKKTDKYTICQNLFDPNSRISVRIQRNRELGIVVWDGGTALQLRYVPNSININKGDVVYTSGMSQIFPPNIRVGIITEVQKTEDQLFQTIRVKPVVNFNRLEEVFILQATE